MTGVAMHRLVRNDQDTKPLRLRIADWLSARRLDPAQVALLCNIDKRTAYRALTGTCTLDTYDALVAGIPELEDGVMRVHAAKWEKRLAREKAEIAAREERLARLRTAGTVDDGRSWLAPVETGPWAPSRRERD